MEQNRARREVVIPPIKDVADFLHIDYAESGNELRAHCPFCYDPSKDKESKRTMTISTVGDVFNCFYCHTSGRTLSLYAKVKHGAGFRLLKTNFAKVYQEFWQDYNGGVELTPISTRPTTKRYPPSGDRRLNAFYYALLTFPDFALTPEHRKNLMMRGLPEDQIEKNMYRSVPADWDKMGSVPSPLFKKLRQEAKKYSRLAYYDGRRLRLSYLAAQWAIEHADQRPEYKEPYGVPGFFKLADVWMVKLSEGMMIPVRNIKREIVGIQTRVDNGSFKYVTMSANGLPYGVSEMIARIHYPMANKWIQHKGKVAITEGPLKADIAAYYMNIIKPTDGYAFLALPGVQTTSRLPFELERIEHKYQIKEIYNCFDMDKLTNLNVNDAMKGLSELLKKHGWTEHGVTWAPKYGKKMLEKYTSIALKKGLSVTLTGKWESDLTAVCRSMKEAGVDYATDSEGHTVYWSPVSKGIDDYLWSVIKYKSEQRSAKAKGSRPVNTRSTGVRPTNTRQPHKGQPR